MSELNPGVAPLETPALREELRAKEDTIIMFEAALKSVGINFCDELADEQTPWEVPAEPEPQYFETVAEALKFLVELPERELESQLTQVRGELASVVADSKELQLMIEDDDKGIDKLELELSQVREELAQLKRGRQ